MGHDSQVHAPGWHEQASPELEHEHVEGVDFLGHDAQVHAPGAHEHPPEQVQVSDDWGSGAGQPTREVSSPALISIKRPATKLLTVIVEVLGWVLVGCLSVGMVLVECLVMRREEGEREYVSATACFYRAPLCG